MFKRKIIKENKLKSYLLKILKIHGLNKETLNLVNPNYSKQSENYFKLNDKTIILSNGVLDLKRKINELNILYRFAPNNSLWNSSKRWKRIIPNIDKKTLIKVCLFSLKKSLVNFINKNDIKIKLNLITESENYDEKFNIQLIEMIKCDKIEVKLNFSKKKGNHGTYLECCDLAEDAKDLIFFVEDDYLFEENAINELIYAYTRIATLIENDVFLCPCDYPFFYDSLYNTNILFGKNLRWRKVNETLLTFLFSINLLKKFRKNIRLVGEEYNDPFEKPLHEVYQKNYCFAPIGSLSYHISRTVPAINENWFELWQNTFREVNGGP